jgi:predicted DNA-binding protein YlxM (UPF0122 family)
MNNILIYAILGVTVGILIYMFSCEIKKSLLISKYNNYVTKFGANDGSLSDITIPDLISKNDSCTTTLRKIEAAITAIQKKYDTEKAARLETLKQCNTTVDSKLLVLQKYLDKTVPGVTAEDYMKTLDRTFDRNKFK